MSNLGKPFWSNPDRLPRVAIRKLCTLKEGGKWVPYSGQEKIAAFGFEWEGQLIVYDYKLARAGLSPLRLAPLPEARDSFE